MSRRYSITAGAHPSLRHASILLQGLYVPTKHQQRSYQVFLRSSEMPLSVANMHRCCSVFTSVSYNERLATLFSKMNQSKTTSAQIVNAWYASQSSSSNNLIPTIWIAHFPCVRSLVPSIFGWSECPFIVSLVSRWDWLIRSANKPSGNYRWWINTSLWWGTRLSELPKGAADTVYPSSLLSNVYFEQQKWPAMFRHAQQAVSRETVLPSTILSLIVWFEEAAPRPLRTGSMLFETSASG
jgi:hypothetical protein